MSLIQSAFSVNETSVAVRVWKQILADSVAIVPSPLPISVYEKLYKIFDDFVKFVDSRPEYADKFDETAKSWGRESGLQSHFGGYFTPYYRDRTGKPTKDQKQIFQFCAPYYHYLLRHHPDLLGLPPFEALVTETMVALGAVYAACLPLVNALREINKPLYTALFAGDFIPPVVLRVLRYESDRKMGTNPHVDKSVLSVILDTDDPSCDARLVFAPTGSVAPRLSEFIAPANRRGDAIMFFGAAPREAGFADFRPAVHAVLPATEDRVRHSIIFFWLMPGVDMKSFNTSVPFVDDMGVSRQYS